jgi:hypothetical protein
MRVDRHIITVYQLNSIPENAGEVTNATATTQGARGGAEVHSTCKSNDERLLPGLCGLGLQTCTFTFTFGLPTPS